MHYLDHNATSPARPEAKAAMLRALECAGNPSSVHRAGRTARAIVEEAREQVAKFAGARPEDVIFTSGGSEANALAVYGAVQGTADTDRRISAIFSSPLEHDSVGANIASLSERMPGMRRAEFTANADGVLDLDALRLLLRKEPGRALVAVMAANNETGVIQPYCEAVTLVHEAGGLCLIDAVQAVGRIAFDFAAIGADYVSISAHKLGGPQGAGALIVRKNAPLLPLICGGGQEMGRRAGTENVAGIAGFGAAAAESLRLRSEETRRLTLLRDAFEENLQRIIPEAVILGRKVARLSNTSNFILPGITAETALMALDLDDIMVSSGSACSSGKVRPSRSLGAMGVSDELARCALRVSFGWSSVQADADAALAALGKLAVRMRARRAA
ncbi:MAG TPA: cysteine desulfurase family protein [Rhizomicrobium sp.]|jgi:cysteine desulfurase